MNAETKSPLRQSPNITVILDRLRSAHNTGNIFRLAEALGAKEEIGRASCRERV